MDSGETVIVSLAPTASLVADVERNALVLRSQNNPIIGEYVISTIIGFQTVIEIYMEIVFVTLTY